MNGRYDRPADASVVCDGTDGDPDEPVSDRVRRAASAATGLPPRWLPSLSLAVNVDALDRLFPADGGYDCTVSFRYAGTDVFVTGDRAVHVVLVGPD